MNALEISAVKADPLRADPEYRRYADQRDATLRRKYEFESSRRVELADITRGMERVAARYRALTSADQRKMVSQRVRELEHSVPTEISRPLQIEKGLKWAARSLSLRQSRGALLALEQIEALKSPKAPYQPSKLATLEAGLIAGKPVPLDQPRAGSKVIARPGPVRKRWDLVAQNPFGSPSKEARAVVGLLKDMEPRTKLQAWGIIRRHLKYNDNSDFSSFLKTRPVIISADANTVVLRSTTVAPVRYGIFRRDGKAVSFSTDSRKPGNRHLLEKLGASAEHEHNHYRHGWPNGAGNAQDVAPQQWMQTNARRGLYYKGTSNPTSNPN